jgi:hypothetical protein
MTDHTPSQAEGEPDDEDVRDMEDHLLPGDPTPSQAEGEREEDEQGASNERNEEDGGGPGG